MPQAPLEAEGAHLSAGLLNFPPEDHLVKYLVHLPSGAAGEACSRAGSVAGAPLSAGRNRRGRGKKLPLRFFRPQQKTARSHFVEVPDEVELTDVREVLVEHFDEEVDHLQARELVF